MMENGFWGRALRNRSRVFILLLCILPSCMLAQEVQVRGGFLSDSLKIGEQTAFYLSARYPSELTVLFPDSTYSFSPFEYQTKEYFLTETTGGVSADSTVYYLTTFEVDRLQYLRLPVYVVQESDCTVFQTEPDSVLVTQFVAEVPDSLSADKLPLRMNTAYQKVFYNFNVWFAIIVVAILIGVVLITWLLFGKKIRRHFVMKRLQKNHAYFLNTYNSFLTQLSTAFSPPATESALVTWKKYMEQLESRPYTKLTTRETVGLVQEPGLKEHLIRIDKAIYGHDTTVVEALENLKGFANQQFQRRLKEVQHG